MLTYFGIAIGYQSDIDDAFNFLPCWVKLGGEELTAARAKGLEIKLVTHKGGISGLLFRLP